MGKVGNKLISMFFCKLVRDSPTLVFMREKQLISTDVQNMLACFLGENDGRMKELGFVYLIFMKCDETAK